MTSGGGRKAAVTTQTSRTSPEVARKALRAAQATFLHWLDKVAPLFADQVPDLAAFNRIAKAAKELRAALSAASDELGRERLLLVGFLQDDLELLPKQEFDSQLDYLDELLGSLESVGVLGIKPGPQPDPRAQVWVWIAADSWVAVTKEAPAGGERSAFWSALQDFWTDQDRSPRIPATSEQSVKTALIVWRNRRTLLAG